MAGVGPAAEHGVAGWLEPLVRQVGERNVVSTLSVENPDRGMTGRSRVQSMNQAHYRAAGIDAVLEQFRRARIFLIIWRREAGDGGVVRLEGNRQALQLVALVGGGRVNGRLHAALAGGALSRGAESHRLEIAQKADRMPIERDRVIALRAFGQIEPRIEFHDPDTAVFDTVGQGQVGVGQGRIGSDRDNGGEAKSSYSDRVQNASHDGLRAKEVRRSL